MWETLELQRRRRRHLDPAAGGGARPVDRQLHPLRRPDAAAGGRRERAPIEQPRHRRHLDVRLLLGRRHRQQHDQRRATRWRLRRSATTRCSRSTTTAGGIASQPRPDRTSTIKRSNADGSWTGVVVGSQVGGDGHVFATTATHRSERLGAGRRSTHDDSRLSPECRPAPASTRRPTTRRPTPGPARPAPPPFGAGQAFKSGGGLFGAHDATSTWLFVINTDAANTILYTKHDGTTWSPWAPVPGTDSGTHARRFISGHPVVAAGQIGLIWTEGSVHLRHLRDRAGDGRRTPTRRRRRLTARHRPTDRRCSARVDQRQRVGRSRRRRRAVPARRRRTSARCRRRRRTSCTWDSRTVANGTHSIAAIATDGAGNCQHRVGIGHGRQPAGHLRRHRHRHQHVD